MADKNAPIGIAIDAMGGDAGPQVVVEGVVRAMRASEQNLDIYLVGDTHRIELELGRHGDLPKRPQIEHTTQEIQMEDKAASSLRRKKDSSIARGLQLQKDGKAQAFVSAGNTGAVVASSLLALGRLPGVRRPGIATYVPGNNGGYVLLDVGATKDCKPIDLVTFGQMGSVYAERILKRPNPRIGLLNIGEEEGKGNELTREAYELFQTAEVNFVGNVESNALFQRAADVAVCDG
ncbi:MAG: phosphate acyltransferase, partial [Gemmatimonadetes bacterium]|nr:phosphate acyltransferase [Gemmatimonadota bacterium]